MINQGLFIVFEGADGCGKTSTMRNVANLLAKRLETITGNSVAPNIIQTHHPGSTALGKHIRKLVKFPTDFDPDIQMDSMSRQLLYMVDTVNFMHTILEPALKENKIVLADRSSFISAIVYGQADGLTLKDVDRLFSVAKPPIMDRLFVLQCPFDVVQARLNVDRAVTGSDNSGKLDHYDSKPTDYSRVINNSYAELITTSAEQTAIVTNSVKARNVVSVDSSQSEDIVASTITDDILEIIDKRQLLQS